MVDTNGKVTPDIIGGDQGGRNKADANCSGQAISQDFLEKIAQSGEDLVIERAKQNTAGTILLLQHYPGKCPRETFENALPASRKEKVKVLCAYGHEHTQGCEKKDKSGNVHRYPDGWWRRLLRPNSGSGRVHCCALGQWIWGICGCGELISSLTSRQLQVVKVAVWGNCEKI